MIKHYWERKQHIDRLFDNIKKSKVDEEVASYLAKYLCVVVSGFLETTIREIYEDYTRNKSHQNVASYVSKQLKRFRSPKTKNILSLAESFCSSWKEEIEQNIDSAEIRDSVDSLVNNRNNIAHGVDVGITYNRVCGYYLNSIKLIKIVEKQCAK